MSNKIEELCRQLEIEADKESNLIEEGASCDKVCYGFDCTRPKHHEGFHIACGMGPNLYLMWKENISDE